MHGFNNLWMAMSLADTCKPGKHVEILVPLDVVEIDAFSLFDDKVVRGVAILSNVFSVFINILLGFC